MNSPNKKRAPQRTCIACRETQGKRELIRLVRTADGVEVDATGKKAGRGAYLHKKKSCWESALKGNVLDQALKTTLTAEQREQLRADGEKLPD
ncbi:MAG: YlxR family protein [Chloroflexi bacterium]|nr:YlxR family protein [Chloroflexota bacterium]MBI5053817.1 YlxR family protein [Chloroflexota bacterium]MBI5081809.1 YlxR family protein [Chloroflexota bacterium]MBI5348992.1 YlxR family protein [Chloroflexota bacterium]